ncbi:FMN-binding negative transcriptional regulator [Rhizobium yanglingense]
MTSDMCAAWSPASPARMRRHRRTHAKMTDSPKDYIDMMLKAIVGVEIEITRLTGKFKLSQNREARDILEAGRDAAEAGRRADRRAAWWPSARKRHVNPEARPEFWSSPIVNAQSVVIVGAGHSGAKAAAALRKHGWTGERSRCSATSLMPPMTARLCPRLCFSARRPANSAPSFRPTWFGENDVGLHAR